MRTSIYSPRADLERERVIVPLTTPWSNGPTTRHAEMSPSQAENLAHQLIVAAAEVRRQRQQAGVSV